MNNLTHDIVDLSYPSKKVKEFILDTVGKPYGIFKKFKMKGVGSSRLIIANYSEHFEAYFDDKLNINYASIELRPKGILVHFYQGQSHFAWLIPHFRLNYYHTETHGVYSNGKFICFHKEFLKVRYDAFFKKMAVTQKEANHIFNGGPNPGMW